MKPCKINEVYWNIDEKVYAFIYIDNKPKMIAKSTYKRLMESADELGKPLHKEKK